MAKYVACIILAVVLLFPMYWMISGSFQNTVGLMAMPPKFFPSNPTLASYRSILTRSYVNDGYILRAMLNTVVLVVMMVSIHVFVCFTAGYVFALYNFRGKEALFWMFVMAVSVGRYQLLIPHFVLIAKLGLVNTLFGVALPSIFSPIAVFLFRNYLLAIPKSLIDTARLDGAGETRILAKIILPMCRPILGLVALMGGVAMTGDYLWPSLVLQDSIKRTIYVEIVSRMRSMERGFQGDLPRIGLGLAGGTLLLIPMMLIFVLTSRYMIDGLNTGGIKE